MQTTEQGPWFLSRMTIVQGFRVLLIAASLSVGLAAPTAAATRPSRAGHAACAPCEGSKPHAKGTRKLAQKVSCHPQGYVDPKIAKNYQKAIRDLHRAGIRPQVTSAWRSSAEQARLHHCSNDRRCRARHPGLYYALPPGQSLHEAGFAVDISGVAAGPKGSKQVTPRGRHIISVMRKNGFKWRYGLKDPAHFEADPTRKGYRSLQQAIHKNQTTCTVRLAKQQKPAGRTQASTSRKAVSSKPLSSHRRNSKA